MTVIVTPVNNWGASVPIPADGEFANSASVLQYVQELTNRLEYLRNRVIGANAAANQLRLFFPLTTGLSEVPASWTAEINATSKIPQIRNNNFTGSPWVVRCDPFTMLGNSTGANAQYYGSAFTIKRFGAYLTGASGHAALPGTMPKVELCSQSWDPTGAGSTVVLDTATDASGSTVVFQGQHEIAKQVTINYQSFAGMALRFYPENGANSLVNSLLTGLFFDICGT